MGHNTWKHLGSSIVVDTTVDTRCTVPVGLVRYKVLLTFVFVELVKLPMLTVLPWLTVFGLVDPLLSERLAWRPDELAGLIKVVECVITEEPIGKCVI